MKQKYADFVVKCYHRLMANSPIEESFSQHIPELTEFAKENNIKL